MAVRSRKNSSLFKLIFLQRKADGHTALTPHGTSEQRQIPIAALHCVNGGWRQRLPFHHSVGENIPVHIREGVAVEYVSCEPSENLKKLFPEQYGADDDDFEKEETEQA